MSAEIAMERAERGAALLDEKRPGWERKVDLGLLDLANPCRCIVGQVCGSFSLALSEILPPRSARTSDYGFAIAGSGRDRPTFAELDEAWVGIIKRRRALGVFSDTE